MRLTQHNDEPASDDALLGRDGFIRKLGQQIVYCKPPQVFGVHGEWGAGKTSVLRRLQHHLSDPNLKGKGLQRAAAAAKREGIVEPSKYSETVLTVWFEAWRYQHEPMPIVALLQEMRRQFDVAARLSASAQAGVEIATMTLSRAFDTAAELMSLEAGKLLNPQRIFDSAADYDKSKLREKLPTDSIREFLSKAIDALLGQLGRDSRSHRTARLVIFIDDLDRCSPEAAYRLLEGLKIHLNLPNCVFVLGMNQGAVIDLIAQFFKRDNEIVSCRLAESYLEKLCANVWRLPPVRRPIDLLCYWLSNPSPEVNHGDADLRRRVESLDIELLNRCLPPNPRKIKALANTILMLWDCGCAPIVRNEDSFKMQCLLFMAYVYCFHQSLYRRWVLDKDFYEELKNGWAKGNLRKNLQEIFNGLEPTADAVVIDEKTGNPAEGVRTESRYPEPGLHGVFWMTPWLLHREGGQKATASDFIQFLNVHVI